jgi:hypothetical protein
MCAALGSTEINDVKYQAFAIAVLLAQETAELIQAPRAAWLNRPEISPAATAAISNSVKRAMPASICCELCCKTAFTIGIPAGV